jgi:hypothetical protein
MIVVFCVKEFSDKKANIKEEENKMSTLKIEREHKVAIYFAEFLLFDCL